MTTTQDPIAHASRLLREAAEELRQAHTLSSDRNNWIGEPEAKAAYDEHMAAAQALEDWEAAVGAGGVQALSAAPAGWKLVPVEPTNDMQKAADEWAAKGFDWPKAVYRAMLAASPPAKQQAAPKAAPGDALDEVMRERDEAEDFINELLDEVLGADRPEWSSAYNRYDAMSDVRERITALHKPAVDKAWDQFQSAKASPQQEAQEPYAYAVYFPDQPKVELVHDLDELIDDLTNRQHTITKLYTAPAPLSDDVVRDAAFESVRKKLCALPRYSFVLDDDGLVRRVQDRTGNWIEFDDTHELFDPVAVDAALAAQGGQ